MELPDREMMALINVTIFDVLNNNTVVLALPVGVAANVCGIAVNLLATGTNNTPGACTAMNTTTANLPVGLRP